MASFLYCSPYSYRSFTILKALAKSNGNLFARKIDIFRESNQEKKQRSDTMNEAKKIKSDNFKMSNKEKSNIGITILGK